MNKDINKTLMALVPILRMNGENVTNIEAVHDWYKDGDREYMKEVAEITYDNGTVRYADIGCDSNLTAIYDVIAVIQQIKPRSKAIERIERGVYSLPSAQPERKGTRLSTVCLLCKKPAVTFNTEDDIPYTNYSYCEDCLRKGLKLLKEQKKNLQTQPEQRWIPCSEKLPKKSGQYYVSGESKVWICEFLTIHSSTKLLGGWCNDAANPVVQAWMPLPEPYKPDPCNGCGYLGESCVGEGCGKLTERKDGEA